MKTIRLENGEYQSSFKGFKMTGFTFTQAIINLCVLLGLFKY